MLLIPVVYTAIFGVFILSGLFAILIATRQWHWVARAAILIGSVSPLLLVEANDLLLILLVSQMAILLGVLYEGMRQERLAASEKENPNQIFFIPKFKLSDLMCAVITVCGLMAMLSQTIDLSFLEFNHLVGIGCAFGFWSLMAVAVVDWKVDRRTKIVVFFVGMNVTLIWAALDDQWLVNGTSQSQKLFAWLILLMIVSTYIFLTVSMVKFLKQRSPFSSGSPRYFAGHPVTAMLFAFLATSLVGITGSTVVCYSWLLNPPLEPTWVKQIVPGERNGFDDFASAGSALGRSGMLTGATPTLPGQPLRDELDAYSTSFDQIGVGLARENQFCLDLTSDEMMILSLGSMPMRQISSIRRATFALGLKSRQAIADGNDDEAITNGLLSIRMAQCLSHGELFTHISGTSCEQMGSHWIQIAIENASTPKLEEAATTLKQIEADSLTLEQIFANERFYMWKTNNWKGRLANRAMAELLSAPVRDLVVTATDRRDSVRAQLRTAIALELFKRDHGNYPTDLFELVPNYLDRVLADPFPTDSPNDSLKYLRNDSGSGFRLYSVNMNGTDEGGKRDPQPDLADMNYAEIVRKDEESYLESARIFAAPLTDDEIDAIPID